MPNIETSKPAHPAVFAIGGFIVGVLLTSAWFLEAQLPRAGEKGMTHSVETATTTTSATSSLVSVQNQKAGNTVIVDLVMTPAPGVWVAVEELHDGQLGNVLGATRTLGPAAAVSVQLLRPTMPGTTYAIVLYRDNGDGNFSHVTDSVYVDFTTGERVVAPFETTL